MSKQKYVFVVLLQLWSARKRKYIRFQRKFFGLHLRGFLLVVVILFVAQVRDQLIQSMRNSDPRVRIVFVYRFNSDFLLVFPRIQPFGSDEFSSLGKVYSRHATGSLNCKNSSVCFVMKYCPTSTVFRNPASIQIFINGSVLWKLSHSFLVLLQ